MKRLLTTLAGGLFASLIGTSEVMAAEVPGSQSKYCRLDANPVIDNIELSPKLRQFLGIFDGKWDGKLSHTVIIYKITKSGGVAGYYAHGTYKPWGIARPSCFKVSGKIRGEEFVLRLRNGAEVTYRLAGDNLHGTYWLKGGASYGLFSRVAAP